MNKKLYTPEEYREALEFISAELSISADQIIKTLKTSIPKASKDDLIDIIVSSANSYTIRSAIPHYVDLFVNVLSYAGEDVMYINIDHDMYNSYLLEKVMELQYGLMTGELTPEEVVNNTFMKNAGYFKNDYSWIKIRNPKNDAFKESITRYINVFPNFGFIEGNNYYLNIMPARDFTYLDYIAQVINSNY